MSNKMTKDIKRLISTTGEKVYFYFAIRSMGDDFDPHEQNYIYTNLNPKTCKAWVSTISAERLVWKQYGLQETGAVELVTESRYKEWFKKANKIVINDEEYAVYKVGANNRVLVYDRPGGLIRVILERKG